MTALKIRVKVGLPFHRPTWANQFGWGPSRGDLDPITGFGETMGKRSKKKRKQYRYNKKQFINMLCRGCNLCGEYVEPDFCYDVCYKNNPYDFINGIYKSLIRMKEWPFQSGKKNTLRTLENETRIFQEIFCGSGCCTPQFDEEHGDQCVHLYECMSLLRWQIEDSVDPDEVVTSHVPRYTKKKKKTKSKGKKVIVEPYPTFVMSGSDAFKARVRRILYGKKTHTDSNDQQVGNEELSDGSSTSSDGGAESRESQVLGGFG